MTDDTPAAAEVTPPATGDTAGQSQPSEQTDKAPDQTDESAAEGLLETEDDRKSWNELPAAERKRLNRLWTQKTQGFAAKRKEVESLLPFKPVYEALQDPERAKIAVKILAQHAGLKLAEEPPAKQANPEEDPHFVALSQQFGPDAAKSIVTLINAKAEQIADAKVAPVQKTLTAEAQRTAAAQAKAVMERFEKDNPNWKVHEPKMLEVAKVLRYQGGDEYEYMDMLLTIATKDERSAEATKKVLDKLTKSAAAADTPDNGVQSSRVSTTLPAYKSHSDGIRAAYELAKQGKVVER